ncbi:MAG: Hsp20/alpha crystallin family protein [Bacteroidota bacterium]
MTFVFNPLREFVHNTTEFEKEFGKCFTAENQSTARYAPAVEITEDDNAYTLEVDLPGVTKDEVKISIDKNVLTIQGERKSISSDEKKSYHYNERAFGNFRRSFNLSTLVKSDAIQASYENGVLKLTLPKAEEAKPREIEVKIS